MKKHFIAMILASMMVSPMALAVGAYGGLAFGQLSSEDIDTGNLGIALGDIADHGFGYELFYSFSAIDDESTVSGVTVEADTDVIGLFIVYQTPGDVYFKGKAGYGFANITFDIEDQPSIDDSTEGVSWGLAGGVSIGEGAIEFTYYRFPDFDNFDGVDVDAEVEMYNFTYLWSF
jgi:hypothetical protein